jgi:hypothetical protein
MIKYGKSGSSDEDGSGSGSDNETEDEEEEEDCQVLLNRVPKRPRQEEKSVQGGATLTPKVERVPVTTSKDRFEAIVKELGEMQVEHRMRGELLRVVCQLVHCTPTSLPDRIRKMVADHSRVEDSKKLRDENAALNLELGNLISENQAPRKQAGVALAAAERIRTFVDQAGEVVAKAELFDEKVGIGSKPSGTRIAMILTDYSEKLERVQEDMREVVDHVTSLRRQPEQQDLAASSSKGVPSLSKLSLPDSFSGLPNVEDYTGVDVMVDTRTFSDGRTNDRTMAAGASVTWTHYSVLFEVTWGTTRRVPNNASARMRPCPRGRISLPSPLPPLSPPPLPPSPLLPEQTRKKN